jgi:membrane-bound metal-dependent hydrolase YbcI (DUF457 family)
MPTPVGHVLAGAAVYFATKDRPLREEWGLVAACVGVSLIPDLDFAIEPFVGRSYHNYFTHSLGFAALFAIIVYLLARALKRSRPARETSILTAVYLSHILLDFLGKDTSPPFGVQLFWPFSDAFIMSPITIFDDVWRGTLAKLFGLHNWMTVAREVLILTPVALLLWWRGRRKPAASLSASRS